MFRTLGLGTARIPGVARIQAACADKVVFAQLLDVDHYDFRGRPSRGVVVRLVFARAGVVRMESRHMKFLQEVSSNERDGWSFTRR
jgi:hypothetical protein